MATFSKLFEFTGKASASTCTADTEDVQWAPLTYCWGALGWCSSLNSFVQSCALHNICDLKFQQDEILARAEEAVKMGTLPWSRGVTAAHTWVTFSCQLWCWQQYFCTDCANLPRTLGEHLAEDVLSVTAPLLFVPQPGNFRCVQDGKASHSPLPEVHNSKGVNQNAWNLLYFGDPSAVVGLLAGRDTSKLHSPPENTLCIYTYTNLPVKQHQVNYMHS